MLHILVPKLPRSFPLYMSLENDILNNSIESLYALQTFDLYRLQFLIVPVRF
jgi:hypothetical protein